jgi:hypothetical protein
MHNFTDAEPGFTGRLLLFSGGRLNAKPETSRFLTDPYPPDLTPHLQSFRPGLHPHLHDCLPYSHHRDRATRTSTLRETDCRAFWPDDELLPQRRPRHDGNRG